MSDNTPTVVAIIPERHDLTFGEVTSNLSVSARQGQYDDVRRPTNGIQLKDETFATLRMVLGNGHSVPLVNAGTRRQSAQYGEKVASDVYSNFLIQSVNEERAEKSQIVETFGEAFIFLFGERPRIITVQGVLLNTFDFNWEAEWQYNYENFLRGTKCVEMDARVYLAFDDTLVSGYILSTSTGKSAQERNHVPFGFQMFVTDCTNVSRLGDPSADQAGAEWGYGAAEYEAPALYKAIQTGENLGLIEGLMRTGIAKVEDAWNRAQQLAQNALTSLSSFVGNPVRVPVGFAGSLVFDSPDIDVRQLKYEPSKPISYSTFGKNDAEFVGGSDYYQPHIKDPDTFRYMFDAFSGRNSADESQRMTELATEQWQKNGFIFAPPVVGKITTLMRKTGIGMQVLAGAQQMVGMGGALVDFGFGMTAPAVVGAVDLMDTVGLADDIRSDVAPGSNARFDAYGEDMKEAVDRAAATVTNLPIKTNGSVGGVKEAEETTQTSGT